MNKGILTATGAAAMLLLAQAAHATPVQVGTVNGFYDVDLYDTPSIHITNTDSTFSFTDVVLTLTGYQGQNNGLVQSRLIGNVGPGATEIYTWTEGYGGTIQGDLFSYDYDDSGKSPSPSQCDVSDPISAGLCADVGNFYVTLTAMFDGMPIYSQFGPDPCNPSGVAPFSTCNGNVPGTFIGWEGLDPAGYSETSYDSHSDGGPSGVLANIYIGTPPTPVPEPGTLSLLALGGFGMIRRRWTRR